MKPLILITNDDGIFAPGLIAAASAVERFGDLLIAGPRYQQSAMSRSFPNGEMNGIIEVVELNINGKLHPAYGVHGSPAQVVSHAILELASQKPALCVSGINDGANLGQTLTCSGTIGAALEAYSYNVPGLAVSIETNTSGQQSYNDNQVDWKVAICFTKYLAEHILNEGLPPEVALLNVNIPMTATTETEIRVTSQSHQEYLAFKKPAIRDFSKSYEFEVEIKADPNNLEPGSDIQAVLFDHVVSVTPITGDLTAKVKWELHSN